MIFEEKSQMHFFTAWQYLPEYVQLIGTLWLVIPKILESCYEKSCLNYSM
jgi:hypothetical protein